MARYTPGSPPTEPAALAGFLRQELDKIAQAMETQDEFLALKTLHAAPNKYREGTIVLADGSDWSPGAGAGVYVYRGAAWHLLG